MRELTLRQAEGGLKVFCKVLLLLHGSNYSLVNLLLVGGLGFWECLLCLRLSLLEKLSLCRA